MLLPTCRYALEKLKAFQLTEVSVNSLEAMIELASRFVNELVLCGGLSLISTREDWFAGLTAEKMPFDEHLKKVRQALSRPRHKPKRQGERLQAWTTLSARLTSREEVSWRFAEACEDVERLLEFKISKRNPAVRALEEWRVELWDLKVANEHDHIFGCYLLMQCYKLHEKRRQFAVRMQEDAGKLVAIIKDTAEFLVLEAEQNPSSRLRSQGGFVDDTPSDQEEDVTTGAKAKPQQRNNPDPSVEPGEDTPSKQEKPATSMWWHAREERIPDKFAHGPVIGNQSRLALAICPLFGDGAKEPRVLHQIGVDGYIWIVRIRPQLLWVWFQEEPHFNAAKDKMRSRGSQSN